MMELSKEALVEKKLYILHAMDKMNIPLNNLQITNMILEMDLMDYFSLQQYLLELEAATFIVSISEDKKACFQLSPKGKKMVDLFIDRIPYSIQKTIKQYTESHQNNPENPSGCMAEITYDKQKGHQVHFCLENNGISYFNLSLSVPNKEIGEQMAARWQNRASKQYLEIIEVLFPKK